MGIGKNQNQSRLESFRFAFAGLVHVLTYHKNFQIQAAIGALVLIGAWLFNFTRAEWLILLITIALVLTAELINTVVEIVVDLAVKEQLLPEAKLAKDVSAAAVLLLSIFSIIIGLLLFLPHLGQINIF